MRQLVGPSNTLFDGASGEGGGGGGSCKAAVRIAKEDRAKAMRVAESQR